jgi:hypothetical protein
MSSPRTVAPHGTATASPTITFSLTVNSSGEPCSACLLLMASAVITWIGVSSRTVTGAAEAATTAVGSGLERCCADPVTEDDSCCAKTDEASSTMRAAEPGKRHKLAVRARTCLAGKNMLLVMIPADWTWLVRIREVSPLLQVRVNLTPMSQELLEEASAPRWASRFFWVQMMKPASVKGHSVHHSAPTDGERQIKTGTHRPEMPLRSERVQEVGIGRLPFGRKRA